MAVISEADLALPPTYTAQKIYKIIRKMSGNNDPYRDYRKHFNRLALEVYPHLKYIVENSSDSFRPSVLIALAGNVIDFTTNNEIRLLRSIRDMMDTPPFIDNIEELERSLKEARRVLYIGDNAGEVVLDRLLIETAPGNATFHYGVRGGPVLNNVTLEDANACGVNNVAAVISSGSDAPGTILKQCSGDFKKAFEEADFVIAKGMGNLETLCNVRDKKIFFLFLVKCKIVADYVGCTAGKSVVLEKSENMVCLDFCLDDAGEERGIECGEAGIDLDVA
jgi:uncharacterized protein with ATP-grasp and redox domains